MSDRYTDDKRVTVVTLRVNDVGGLTTRQRASFFQLAGPHRTASFTGHSWQASPPSKSLLRTWPQLPASLLCRQRPLIVSGLRPRICLCVAVRANGGGEGRKDNGHSHVASSQDVFAAQGAGGLSEGHPCDDVQCERVTIVGPGEGVQRRRHR